MPDKFSRLLEGIYGFDPNLHRVELSLLVAANFDAVHLTSVVDGRADMGDRTLVARQGPRADIASSSTISLGLRSHRPVPIHVLPREYLTASLRTAAG
jgi:hypothetical protein